GVVEISSRRTACSSEGRKRSGGLRQALLACCGELLRDMVDQTEVGRGDPTPPSRHLRYRAKSVAESVVVGGHRCVTSLHRGGENVAEKACVREIPHV